MRTTLLVLLCALVAPDTRAGSKVVVAQSGTNGYSSVTDASGVYAIYNIPASQCTARACG